MKRRRVVIIGAAVIVVAGLAAVLWPREREPEYQGKKLSEWIGTMKPAKCSDGTLTGSLVADRHGRSVEDTLDAVRHMGTNGVECLVRWMGEEPPGWRLAVSKCSQRLPETVRGGSAYYWLVQGQGYRAMAAELVLIKLRPEELPVQDLKRIATNTDRPHAARRADQVLMRINVGVP